MCPCDLHPLSSASGRRVTRAFPMEQVAGESTDHAHQRGVWIGAEQVSGIDFWENERSYDAKNQGVVLLTDVTDVHSGVGEWRFTIHAAWNDPTSDPRLLEVFNVTNHRNLIRVNNIYGEGPEPPSTFLSPVAGITNADPARQLQLAVKMLF